MWSAAMRALSSAPTRSLEEKVSFFDLGMVVVDEQHRFGVEQRDVLRGRGKDGAPALPGDDGNTHPAYRRDDRLGDLDTSTLRELPRGQQLIGTTVVPMGNDKWVDRVGAGRRGDRFRQAGIHCLFADR